ncbi:MAG: hypothetical protein R3E31_28745 [Chloroflexota bacterium]
MAILSGMLMADEALALLHSLRHKGTFIVLINTRICFIQTVICPVSARKTMWRRYKWRLRC